jgi:steroid delta-isomerase-like uncharacterized protein
MRVIADQYPFGWQARTGDQKRQNRQRRHPVADDKMSEANKRLVSRAVEEVWSKGNFSILDEFVLEDVVVHSADPADDIHGPEGITQFYSGLREAFPDIHFTIEDQIADGDQVVTRWTASATHRGAFQGLPPTGKAVRMAGIDIDRFVGGRVAECWSMVGELSILQQLGALPGSEPESHQKAA